ncbi:MAG TPA: hypothetical protein VFC51_07335 [Chloroflexota bacterium]|nr:hypothetical protein [Chloroflexota bacterium]
MLAVPNSWTHRLSERELRHRWQASAVCASYAIAVSTITSRAAAALWHWPADPSPVVAAHMAVFAVAYIRLRLIWRSMATRHPAVLASAVAGYLALLAGSALAGLIVAGSQTSVDGVDPINAAASLALTALLAATVGFVGAWTVLRFVPRS